ncbi:MAG: hypothetical protein Q4G09_02150 [Clostridia bacterium]|nr:hypothetical protein [Clostridia bacterium]
MQQLKKMEFGEALIKHGVISKELTINLDNSIYIDFIAEWHLSDNGLYYEK